MPPRRLPATAAAPSPYISDVVALMSNEYLTHSLGHIPAVRRRVLKLLCPSSPQSEALCLSILHTLHDILHGLPADQGHAAVAPPQSHYDAADAILAFSGLPARGTVTKEQQVCTSTISV